MNIVLGPGETAVANVIATLRQSVNREAGIKNLKAGKQDPITTEIVGILGEFAFAKWAGLWPDLSTHLRHGSFDNTFRGWSVDVKSTRNPRGDLYVDARADKRADIYVLVHVEYASCTIIGWIAGGTVERAATGETPQQALIVPQRALRHPDTLLQIRPA